MKIALIILGVLLLGVLLLGGMFVGVRNDLVVQKNAIDGAFAQVDVVLQRRADLIPNLVETVKGYASHERGTLEAVTEARSALQNASGPAAAADANNQITQALRSIFALSEAYPDLKANQNMMQLTEELTSTENKISFARQAYNDSVMTYNTTRETFPNVLFAGMFGFTAAQLFQIEDATERNAPKVSFS